MSLQPLQFSGGDVIPPEDFARVRGFIYRHCGIDLTDTKKVMVTGRLRKQLNTLNINSFSEYLDYIQQPGNQQELQNMIDILTTNETYFFREPEHFVFLEELIKKHPEHCYNIWSAASSSGEELYSISMVLADFCRAKDWRVLGSDLSTRVLQKAKVGHYTMDRHEGISQQRLQKYCLKGIGNQQGSFLINPELKKHTEFKVFNLLKPNPSNELFDIIFLRNVMIYFDKESKQKVLTNVLTHLRKGGYLFISHTESLFNTEHSLKTIRPSIFQSV